MIKNELMKRILSSFFMFPLCIYFIINGSYLFIFFIFTLFFISAYEWSMMSKNKYYKITGLFFLFFSFYSAFLLRTNFTNGTELFLFVLLICIMTDLGGYSFGKIFKGPSLTKISPKKTYSGMVGSYFFTLIILFVEFKYINILFTSEKIFIIGILISTVSQLGDLTISYFKRKKKIKDTGKLIPGHGGLLDRIDGVIFAFPFFFLLLKNNFIQ